MITVNLDKAKGIAHDVRRAKRTEEFAPLDIKATIPSEAAAAEQARADIRTADALVQESIDNADNVDAVKVALVGYNALEAA
jgi:Holliday junction resolvasome RuvABC endonuclease subunit